ncbi:MAG TPA: sugar porter family MFS transporter [Sphingomonas sp.]|nr:sugar porter family MFS transporter [Sphingomonas sp.]
MSIETTIAITDDAPAPARVDRLSYTIGALGGGIRGYELGVVAGALLFAAPALHMGPALTGWVVSAALLGSLFGALGAGPAADRIGRRRIIAVAAFIFSLGIVGAALSPDVAMLIASRLVLGVAVGIATAIIPVYISEIAPAQERGAHTGLFQIMIMIGVLASSIVALALAPYGAWRWMFGLGLLPALAMLVGTRWLPESPRWLVKRGRDEEARRVLARLRSGDVEPELEQIRAINRRETGKATLAAMIAVPATRRLLLVGCGLGAFQQLIGINAVTYYAPSVLKGVGFTDWTAVAANLAISAVGLATTILMALVVVDRFGRRKPLMWGALGMAASMALLGAVFLSGTVTGAASYVALLGLIGFQICFALSWGGIVWIVLGEMFPLRLRGTAMGVAVFATEITSVVVGAVFPVLLQQGPAAMFFGFAVMGVLAFLWAAFLLPETGRRTLEDIEADMLDASARPCPPTI